MSQAAKKSPSAAVDPLVLSKNMYDALAQKIYQISGSYLPFNDKNNAFVNQQLAELIRDYNLKSFEELNEALKLPSEKLKHDFISALTINKTDFFREEDHFDFIKAQLPELLQEKSMVRVWSSACSTGAEPYTLALITNEILDPADQQKIKILATDIDVEVLRKAVQAQYTLSEMEGLQLYHKKKYFTPVAYDLFELSPEVARSVQFAEFNLLNHQYRFQKKFDIIFCRNVLIYFDKKTTDQVLDLLVSNLEIRGHLIIGHSESGAIRHPCLKSLGNSIFQKIRN